MLPVLVAVELVQDYVQELVVTLAMDVADHADLVVIVTVQKHAVLAAETVQLVVPQLVENPAPKHAEKGVAAAANQVVLDAVVTAQKHVVLAAETVQLVVAQLVVVAVHRHVVADAADIVMDA